MIVAQSAALVIGFILNLLIGADFGRVMKKIVSRTEKILRKIFPNKKGGEKAAGFFTLIFVVAISGGAVFALLFFAYRFHMVVGAVVESVICIFLFCCIGKSFELSHPMKLSGNDRAVTKPVIIS